MDELLRFLVVRPPEPAEPIRLAPSAGLQKLLDGKAAATVVQAYRRDHPELATIDELPAGAALGKLADRLADRPPASRAEATAAVEATTGTNPAKLATTPELAGTRERLGDELLISTLTSRNGTIPGKRLAQLVRAGRLVETLAAAPDGPDADGDVVELLRAPITVAAAMPWRPTAPPGNGPGDGPSDGTGDGKAGAPAARRRPFPMQRPPAQPTQPLLDTLRRLLRRLRALGGHDLHADGDQTRSARVAKQPAAAPGGIQVPGTQVPGGGAGPGGGGLPDGGRPTPSRPGPPRMLLSAAAVARLGAAEQQALRDLGLDASSCPLPELVSRVTTEAARLHALLDRSGRPARDVGSVGGLVQPVPQPLPEPAADPAPGAPAPAVPTTVGTASPAGVGELLLIRHQPVRYEPGEIAHVENVLARERRMREHTRRVSTEEVVETETELTSQTERDTQTAERFELEREVSTVAREDARLQAGASVAGSYGPTLEFAADTTAELSRSREQAARVASNYSKEVTSRAASKVVERRRERRVHRTVTSTVERNKHGFDNVAGENNITGIYQHLDKILEAQVFSYGKRLLFDITVPEPGALLLQRMLDPAPAASVAEPPAFDVSVADIEPETYLTFVERYGASGVEPPPAPFLAVTRTFDGTVTAEEFGSTRLADLPLPEGYEAMRATIGANSAFLPGFDPDGKEWQIWVHIAGQHSMFNRGKPLEAYLDLGGEVGSLSVAVRTGGVRQWVATVDVDCRCTAERLDDWRLQTFAALTEAQLRQREEFEQAVATLRDDADRELVHRPPAENRRVEQEELKRLALTMLTGQEFELFGAVNDADDGLPGVELAEATAEGRYIRFFEQAFEWERMSYRLFPYFWSRRAGWLQRLALDDRDPQFAEFLRAGAARVLVAARPGFELAVLYYLTTGSIWEGAEPPEISSDALAPLVAEITALTDRSDVEEAVGEPWEVRLPTSLVALRDGPGLPTWTRNDAGR